MDKDKTYYVIEKGTNIIQLIAKDTPFMGDENASRFKANKLNKEVPESYGYDMITIKEYEDKYNFSEGDTNAEK